jgi:hypothetical protein
MLTHNRRSRRGPHPDRQADRRRGRGARYGHGAAAVNAVVALGVAAVTLTGCSAGSASPGGAETATVTPSEVPGKGAGVVPSLASSASGASTGSAAPPSDTPGSTAAGPARCTAGQLNFAEGGRQGAAGTVNVGIKVANTGPGTCWTYGYVGAQIRDAGGDDLPTTTLRGAQSPYQGPLTSDQQGVPHRVTLAAGEWGWFNLAYSTVPADPACPDGPVDGASLAIIAPDTSSAKVIASSTAACGGSVGVSPILPASTWVY